MNIEELITDLRARINPQYYDQIGTESYERHQVVKALEYLAMENERLRNQILLALSALKDAREMVEDWGSYASPYFQGKHDFTGDLTKLDSAIDAVRGV